MQHIDEIGCSIESWLMSLIDEMGLSFYSWVNDLFYELNRKIDAVLVAVQILDTLVLNILQQEHLEE